MNVMISLPDDVAEKLEQRAADVGQSVPAYASQLVAASITKPTLDEILGPVRADFAKSGMSDDELLNFLRGELDGHRRERKAKST
jgi:hypothetical protein